MTIRCPKCGTDNPSDTLYCEECDWRLDQPYRAPRQRNPLMFSILALVVGAVAVALGFLEASGYGGAVVGAVGLVIGSYSVNLPRYLNPENKTLCVALAAVGAVLSVFGFIASLAVIAGVF